MMTVLAAGGDAMSNMFSHEFMRHAFTAGTAIAVAAGLVGYFVVLRGQVFTGDALSHVAFTGAVVALAAGVDARIGLFAGTMAAGAALGLLGRRGRPDDVVIGSAFAWILGVGVLSLSIYRTTRSSADSAAGVNVLFGSIFGLDAGRARLAVAVAAAVVVAMVVIARPLLFATIDAAVAAARGVPVTALGVAFLAILGACAAEATQAVGALLLVGLLAGPAGAAVRLTVRPYRGMWLSAALAAGAVWAGLTASYAAPSIPPSTAILSITAACYVAAHALPRRRSPGGAGVSPGAGRTSPREGR